MLSRDCREKKEEGKGKRRWGKRTTVSGNVHGMYMRLTHDNSLFRLFVK